MARRGSFLRAVARTVEESQRRQRQAQRVAVRQAREHERVSRAVERAAQQATKDIANQKAEALAAQAASEERFFDHPLANEENVDAAPQLDLATTRAVAFLPPGQPSLEELKAQAFDEERRRTSAIRFVPLWTLVPGAIAVGLVALALWPALDLPTSREVVWFVSIPFAVATLLGAAMGVLAWRRATLAAAAKIAEARLREIASKLDAARAAHVDSERDRIAAVEALWRGDSDAIEAAVVAALDAITLPVECAADVTMARSSEFVLELDLPEVEDMPPETCRMLKSGKLSYKPRPAKEIREQYARFAVAMSFLFTARLLRAVPTARTVTVNGFTQRVDKSTGHEVDDYVLSVTFERSTLAALKLSEMDPLRALNHFDHRIECSRDFKLGSVEPIGSTAP